MRTSVFIFSNVIYLRETPRTSPVANKLAVCRSYPKGPFRGHCFTEKTLLKRVIGINNTYLCMQKKGYPGVTNPELPKTLHCLGFMRRRPVDNNALIGTFSIHLAYLVVLRTVQSNLPCSLRLECCILDANYVHQQGSLLDKGYWGHGFKCLYDSGVAFKQSQDCFKRKLCSITCDYFSV